MTGPARAGPGDGVGFAGVLARSGPPHELGAGLADWEERATTDVQPLPEELPGVGCATRAGDALVKAGRDNGCSPGAALGRPSACRCGTRRRGLHELALLLKHMRQHLALLLCREEVCKALLDERAELRVGTRERCDLVRVRGLLQRAAAGLTVGGVDAERFGEAGVALCNGAFVGAFELAAITCTVGEGAAAGNGLADAATRAGNGDDRATRP